MNFSLFAQMERIDEEQSQKRLYEEYVELYQIADRSGFKTIWTGEHHGMNFTIAPNPFINLADLANKTKNVRLGTGTIIAPFWHPIKLAEEAAMTDIISGGRLEIGIARGAYSFEYDRLADGIDPFSAGSAMREIVPAIKGLWKGDYTGEGEHCPSQKLLAPQNLFNLLTRQFGLLLEIKILMTLQFSRAAMFK